MANKQVNIKKLLRTEDAFLTTSERAYNYYLTHTRQFILGAVGFVIIVAAFFIFVNVRNNNLLKAAEASQAAIASPDPGSAILALGEVIEKYPSSPSARAATLALAQAQAEAKNYAQAVEILEKFVADLKPWESGLKNLALISLGQLYEEQNDLDKASRNYRAAQALAKGTSSSDQGDAAIQSELTLSIGRVLEAVGQKDEAKKVYDSFYLTYPNRGSVQDYLAQYRLASLTLATPVATTSPAVEAVPLANDSPADNSSRDNATVEQANVTVEQANATVENVPAANDSATNETKASAQPSDDQALNQTVDKSVDKNVAADKPKPKPKGQAKGKKDGQKKPRK
ncbi:MAG: tetratricopeptide repeat protein [Deltaproteobacteria bacterium]|nr:tetratricopeptide repeat protein [Deltaproteobacteria bacterium]